MFVTTFGGTCKRPAGLTELQSCVQKPNETLRDYIQRWIMLHHSVENVPDHQAVCAFKEGVKYRELNLKFGRTGDMSLNRMMEIATKYANGEDEDRLRRASSSQSPKKPKEIPIGNRSGKPSQRLPGKPWL